jgi:hypothetical protein
MFAGVGVLHVAFRGVGEDKGGRLDGQRRQLIVESKVMLEGRQEEILETVGEWKS